MRLHDEDARTMRLGTMRLGTMRLGTMRLGTPINLGAR